MRIAKGSILLVVVLEGIVWLHLILPLAKNYSPGTDAHFTDPQFILFALAMSFHRLQRIQSRTSINGEYEEGPYLAQIKVTCLCKSKGK